MKIELHISQFKKMIELVGRVSVKNTSLPVLACLLFEVKKNNLIIKATNLDVGVEVSLPAKSDTEGVIAVPAHTISSFMSNINDKDGVVKMELVSGNLNITSSRSRVTIKTLPSEDFPSIPRITDGQNSEIASNIFIKGLKSVWYSSSTSNIKPELSSVYIYKDGEFMTFAATDSFRLAEKKIRVPSSAVYEDVLLPFKNISEVMRILEQINTNVSVCSNKNLISFEADGVYLVSRIIDGTFPDYHQIIPKSHSTEVISLKEDVIQSMKLSNVFTDKFNQIRFVIDPKEKNFEIQTKNSDIGENKTSIDAAITGEKLEINFNSKYISDCFQSIDADSVSFQLGGMNKPMVIRPASGDGSFMYLVMPMNR